MTELQQTLWAQTVEDFHPATEIEILFEAYRAISDTCTIVKHLSRVSYEAPVNFNESMHAMRHRWFPYKEGFSPSFVRAFLDRLRGGGRVLDPFSGVGTTALEAALTGRDGY